MKVYEFSVTWKPNMYFDHEGVIDGFLYESAIGYFVGPLAMFHGRVFKSVEEFQSIFTEENYRDFKATEVVDETTLLTLKDSRGINRC